MTNLNWQSRTALRVHLTDIGADVEFWEGSYPPKPPSGKRLAKAREIWDAVEATDWRRFLDVDEEFGTAWVSELLIGIGDAVGVGKASDFYRLALEVSPRPNVDGEVGCLVMRRAGVGEIPLSERDMEELEPEIHDGLFDVPGPPLKSPRDELVELALQAYGRAYGYYDYWWGCEDYLQDIDGWRQLLILDGLRIGFIGLHDAQGATLACDIYDLWADDLGNRFTDYGVDAVKLAKRFGDTAGAITRGDTRRWKTREHVRRDLASELGPTPAQLSRARNYLVRAQMDLLHRGETGDDFSGAVNNYGKACEAALQDSLGVHADTSADDAFATALRRSLNEVLKREAREFKLISLTSWSKALSNVSRQPVRRAAALKWIRGLAPEADERWFDALVAGVNDLSARHEKARHSRDVSFVSRQEAERARELAIGVEGMLHKLARLHPKRRGE